MSIMHEGKFYRDSYRKRFILIKMRKVRLDERKVSETERLGRQTGINTS